MKNKFRIILSIILLVTLGYYVKASSGCTSQGTPETHARGKCEEGQPTYDYYYISFGGTIISYPVQREGNYWCDLNQEGTATNECWVPLTPE